MGILDNILGKKGTSTTQTADSTTQGTTSGSVPPITQNTTPSTNSLPNIASSVATNNLAGQTNQTPIADPLTQADSLLGQAPNTLNNTTPPLVDPLSLSTPPAVPPVVPPLDLTNEVASPLTNSFPPITTPPIAPSVNNDPLMTTAISSNSTLNKPDPLNQLSTDLLNGAGVQTSGGNPNSNRGKQLINEIEAKLSELKRLIS